MMQTTDNKFRFPWQTGNHFKLLIDGPVFFSVMLQAIQGAKHYILLELYLVQPGQVSQRFFYQLCQAARRGIPVYLLLDDFGSRSLSTEQKAVLEDCNIQLCFYNPLEWHKHKMLLFRDHRKLLVVDGETAFVGGAGLIDEFDCQDEPHTNWRENMVEIKGNNVHQWQCLFVENWQRWSEIPIQLIEKPHSNWHQQGRVTTTAGPKLLEIKRSFVNHVRNAQQRVWMSTAYFAPSRKLRRTLRRTALRGVDVRLLLPGPITDHPMARYIAHRYYSRMLKDGIRIFEYQPRFMHAKLVLCDDWVSLGSCNIDRWNFLWNLDANQEIIDTDFANSVVQMFAADFSFCHEIKLATWKKRSLIHRLKIWFWTYYIQLADSLLLRLKIIRHWKKIRNQRK